MKGGWGRKRKEDITLLVDKNRILKNHCTFIGNATQKCKHNFEMVAYLWNKRRYIVGFFDISATSIATLFINVNVTSKRVAYLASRRRYMTRFAPSMAIISKYANFSSIWVAYSTD